jgi:hypothetical protein
MSFRSSWASSRRSRVQEHRTVEPEPDGWGIIWPPVGSFPWPRSCLCRRSVRPLSLSADRLSRSSPSLPADRLHEKLKQAVQVGNGVRSLSRRSRTLPPPSPLAGRGGRVGRRVGMGAWVGLRRRGQRVELAASGACAARAARKAHVGVHLPRGCRLALTMPYSAVYRREYQRLGNFVARVHRFLHSSWRPRRRPASQEEALPRWIGFSGCRERQLSVPRPRPLQRRGGTMSISGRAP